jgi:hypothetical protein
VPVVVPIGCGYVDHDREYLQALYTMFPNARRVFGGGCFEDEETHAS